MQKWRIAFRCVVALLLIAGVATGALMLGWYMERRQSDFETIGSVSLARDSIVATDPYPSAIAGDDRLTDIRLLPYSPEAEEDVVDADQSEPPTPTYNTPQQISPPLEAAPIEQNLAQRDAIARAIVDHALADATDEEREIWFNDFKRLPPWKIREVLELRQRLGPLGTASKATTSKSESPRSAGGAGPANLPTQMFPSGTGMPPFVNVLSQPALDKDLGATLAAIAKARTIALHNLANARTPGFKRSRVLFQEPRVETPSVAPGSSDAPHVAAEADVRQAGDELIATQLDFRPGEQQNTGRPFDLAISGEGFFQILDGTETFYTRRGTFSLDASRKLVLVSADVETATKAKRTLLLKPEISIPTDAVEITVSTEGVVHVMQAGQPKGTPIGQIQLQRFINPAGLVSCGETLFRDPGTAGKLDDASPLPDRGVGKLQQGFLELSNVKIMEELGDLESLGKQSEALRNAIGMGRTSNVPHGPRR